MIQTDFDFSAPPPPPPPPAPGLPQDPDYRAWLREPAARSAAVDAHMEMAQAWAKQIRQAWLEGRPHGIVPEPRFRHLLDAAFSMAGI